MALPRFDLEHRTDVLRVRTTPLPTRFGIHVALLAAQLVAFFVLPSFDVEPVAIAFPIIMLGVGVMLTALIVGDRFALLATARPLRRLLEITFDRSARGTGYRDASGARTIEWDGEPLDAAAARSVSLTVTPVGSRPVRNLYRVFLVGESARLIAATFTEVHARRLASEARTALGLDEADHVAGFVPDPSGRWFAVAIVLILTHMLGGFGVGLFAGLLRTSDPPSVTPTMLFGVALGWTVLDAVLLYAVNRGASRALERALEQLALGAR